MSYDEIVSYENLDSVYCWFATLMKFKVSA